MKNLSLYSLIITSLFAVSTQAANHATVTAFDELQSQLTLKPGQSYLGFMKQKVKPAIDKFDDTIRNDSAYTSHAYSKLQQNLIEKGAGVAIRIDRNNYIFNVGYLNGSETDDVKSGRSYGVGPTGKESDPSDLAYLSELEAYLKDEPQSAGDFVEALMLVLTNCDTSGWAKLSDEGQIVATDFLAIYTAESDRHIMVGLSPKTHPWEIDLAAATFVSIFDAETGLIMQDGTLQKGSIKQWWAKGRVGSGIGETRRDRIALQKLIGQNLKNTRAAEELAEQIGQEITDDAIQPVLLYLNSPKGPEKFNERDAGALTASVKKYLLNMQAEAPAVANAVLK